MTGKIGKCLGALLAALLVAAVNPAHAQQPTPAQTDAIRQSCRSDFMANCGGVQPGGRAALQCLQRNAPRLSPSCKMAVAETMGGAHPAPGPAAALPPPPPAPAVAPLRVRTFIMPQRRVVILGICGNDVSRLCHGVTPGGERLLKCLAAQPASLTPECYAAIARVSER